MNISLKTLWENLIAKYPGLKLYDNFAKPASKILFLSGTESGLNADVIYLDINHIYGHNKMQNSQDASIVLFGNQPEELPEHVLLVPPDYIPALIANDMISIFQQFQSWESTVLDAIARDLPLTDIINLSSQVTKDTVYMTDPSLKMLGYTTPTLMNEVSAIWHYQVKYGYMPMHIIRQLMDSGELEYINSVRKAFTYPNTCFNLPYTCKNIFKGDALQAHIFIVSIYSKPSQTHKEIIDSLSQMLGVYLDSHPDTLASYGTFHECFFRDILKNDLQDIVSIKNQLYYFNWNVDDDFELVLIEMEEDNPFKKRFLAEQLEQTLQLSCRVFDYNENMIMLCHNPDKNMVKKFLHQYSVRYNFRSAISKVFHMLTEMPVYYKQTKRILAIGKTMSIEKRVYFNDDYGLYSFIEKLMENHSVFEVCHEGILALYEMDQKNGTEYINTLFEFLNNDRNILRTSKVLYLHRNTLMNRLEKIFYYVDVNNTNAETRHFIMLSIFILKYCAL